MRKIQFRAGILLLLVTASACGGSKVLKEPEPLVVTQSLATASDQRLSVALDWVIVRDGPGTWAKNVDWDEYLISVHNLSGDSLQLTNIVALDSLGTRIDTGATRKQLIKGTKNAKRRYKGEGLEVKAGAGAGTLMVAGAVTGVAAVSVGSAIAVVGGSGALAGAAIGGLVLAPVLAVGGIFRGVNNSKVSNQIESRQTLLPAVLQEGEEKALDFFFPLTPSPRQIELTYVDAQGSHTLIVDTQAALAGLHLVQAEE